MSTKRINTESTFPPKYPAGMILLKETEALQGLNRENFKRAAKSVPFHVRPDIDTIKEEIGHSHLIIDAIFGIGLTRKTAGIFKQAIDRINASQTPVLSVDIPSGLDADSGKPLGSAIEADWTVTMGMLKIAFAKRSAQRWTGRIEVANIGFFRKS